MDVLIISDDITVPPCNLVYLFRRVRRNVACERRSLTEPFQSTPAVGKNLSLSHNLRIFRVMWPIFMPLLACELYYYIFDGPIAHCKRIYKDFIIIVVNCEIFCGNVPLVLCMLMSHNPL